MLEFAGSIGSAVLAAVLDALDVGLQVFEYGHLASSRVDRVGALEVFNLLDRGQTGGVVGAGSGLLGGPRRGDQAQQCSAGERAQSGRGRRRSWMTLPVLDCMFLGPWFHRR